MKIKKTLHETLTEGLKSENPWIALFCQLELGHDVFAENQPSESGLQVARSQPVRLEPAPASNPRSRIELNHNNTFLMQALQERIDELERELERENARQTT